MGIFADLTVKENMLLAARKAHGGAQMDTARLEWIFRLFPAVKSSGTTRQASSRRPETDAGREPRHRRAT